MALLAHAQRLSASARLELLAIFPEAFESINSPAEHWIATTSPEFVASSGGL